MFGGHLTKTQAKIALLIALQLQGNAYTRGVTNVATTKKQQIA